MQKSSSQMEVYIDISFPQETRKISYKQSNFTPKGTRKRKTNITQSQQKDINEKDQRRNK